jgi:DNA-binding LytR/AlgR family response regulator
MPSLSGLDFLKSLKNPPLIIITTAYREFAIEGFELDVIDYLVKPIPLPRFLNAIEKVKKQIGIINNVKSSENESNEQYVFLKVDKKTIRVTLSDIYFIESLKDYIRVKTKIGDFTTHQTLTAISELLPNENFVRIHRSYTIALDKVNAIIGNAVEINGQLLPMGRNYVSEVRDQILSSGIKGS